MTMPLAWISRMALSAAARLAVASPRRWRVQRRLGGKIVSCSAPELYGTAEVAEHTAFLSEPFAGHGEDVPGALGDRLALALHLGLCCTLEAMVS